MKAFKIGLISHWKSKLIFLLVCILLIFFILVSHEQPPLNKALKGVLDVSTLGESIIPLDGEWEFYRNSLLLKGEKNPEYTMLPHTWKDSPIGFATYKLSIKGLIPEKSYILKISYMSTAYVLYLNGKSIAKNGIVGMSKESSVPEYQPYLINFVPKSEINELILQVSNYHHRRGGAFQSILLGEKKYMDQYHFWNIFFDGSFILVFIAMGGLQFLIFIFRKEKSHLFLGLFFFFFGCTQLCGTSEVFILRLWPKLTWAAYQKISYSATYMVIPFFFLFVNNLYGSLQKKILTLLLIPLGCIIIVVFFTSPLLFTQCNPFFQIYSMFTLFITLILLIKAVKLKKKGAMMLLVAFLIICGSAISTLLFVSNCISSGPYLPLSFLKVFKGSYVIGKIKIPLNLISYILTITYVNIFSFSFFIKYPEHITSKTKEIKAPIKAPFITPPTLEYFRLSDRELEVVQLMIIGKNNKEIAKELFVSVSTVKTHISHVFKKTGVKSRIELIIQFQTKKEVNSP